MHKSYRTLGTRLILVAGALAAALVIAWPSQARAFGSMPLQTMSVQIHQRHVELFVDSWEPGLLTPSGLATALARALTTTPSLDEVEWTVQRDGSAESIASLWGLSTAHLLELNPQLEADTELTVGQRLVVYRSDPEDPTLSVGRTNRGRLVNGLPMPEGPYWVLRTNRRRQFGTAVTVRTIVDALTTYGSAFPDGPAVRIGELSSRRGGRIKPHRSHRSGRDADIGYIGSVAQIDGEWIKIGPKNLDPERTWVFIKAMIDSGNVEMMFVDRRIQSALSRVAERELDETELARIFQYPRRAGSNRAIIRHWSGHDHHMHIRFRCEPGNARCR